MKKLERDTLQRTCKTEVEALHAVFVAWFQGKRPQADLEADLKLRLQSTFSHVAPNGQFLLGRKVLIGHLEDKYACYRDRVFSIDIYNVQLLWASDNQCLCTYEEWQSWKPEDGDGELVQFGRLSTCLLEKSEEGRFSWIHVHETWLEAETPPESGKSSAAMGDEETIMTGPIEAHKLKNMPGRRPTTFPEHQDSSDDTRRLLMLMSNQSMSREQVAHQQTASTILKAHNIPYEEVDGTDFHQRERRNELFDISGVMGKYPQFFIAQGGKTEFWGDFEKMQAANEAGTLKNDLGFALPYDKAEEPTDERVEEPEDDEEEQEEEEEEEEEDDEEDDADSETGVAGAVAAGAAVAAVTAAAVESDGPEPEEEEAPVTRGNGAPEWAMETKVPPTSNERELEPEEEESQEDEGPTEDEILQMEPENGEQDDDYDGDPVNAEERAFLEASQGILEFEEEGAEKNQKDEELTEAELAALKESPIPQDASTKRHVSPKLLKYAKPLTWENALVGISVAGFDIGTSQGPIGDEAWYAETGELLEDLAQSRSIPRPRRKICLPEMVFPTAHVAIEGHGFWLSWDVVDALEEWAKAHHEIAIHSRISNNGVSVLRAKDANLWDSKRKHGAATKDVSSIFHYDWTYSTPFCGKVEGGDWVELDESGMRISLLTDQSVPILFFDEIILYEDDMHDNGQCQYNIKIRVMPSCAYVLARLYVLVDNVIVRTRETRLLVDFFGIQPHIYRDITWRECTWEDLAAHNLPTDVKSWHTEQGRETPEWNALVKQLPEVALPKGVYKNAVLERPDMDGSTGEMHGGE